MVDPCPGLREGGEGRDGEGTGLREAGARGKGRGHFGGDPGRLWPPPKWPGHGETGEGSGKRRVSCGVRVEFVREKKGTSLWREGEGTDGGLPYRGRCRLLS